MVAKFLEFDIEPHYDFLGIFFLNSSELSVVEVLTRSSVPDDVVSFNNIMWLYFSSDEDVTHPGFWIEISVFTGSSKLFGK